MFAGMIAGLVASMLVTALVMAVTEPSKFPWADYLQGATVAIVPLTNMAQGAAVAATKTVTNPSTAQLLVLGACVGYTTVALVEGTAYILTGLDALNATAGNALMGFLTTALWVVRLVYESFVPVLNAVTLVMSDTLAHLVTSILECDAADGRHIIVTLLGAPFAGLGALVTAWSEWLMSGTLNAAPGQSYNYEESVFTLPLNTTPAMVEWVDKPAVAIASAASCSCVTLAPALASLAGVVAQPAVHLAVMNAVNVPISVMQMLMRLGVPSAFKGLDAVPVSEYLRRAVFYGIVQIDGAIQLVLTGVFNTASGAGAGRQHPIRLLNVGGPATAVAHGVVGLGSLAMPAVHLLGVALGNSTMSAAEVMDVLPAMAHASAAVHVAAANVAWLQTLVLHQVVPEPSSNPVVCPVFPVDFTSPRYLQKPKTCHCQLQQQACNIGTCTPQGSCVCPPNALHLVPDHVHSPCVERCVANVDCGDPGSGAVCRPDGRCACNFAGLRMVYEVGGPTGIGRCTDRPPPANTRRPDRPVVHVPEQLDFLYADEAGVVDPLCGPGETLVPEVGGAVPCILRYAGDAVLSVLYAVYETVRVGILEGKMLTGIADGLPLGVIEQYQGLPMRRSLASYGTCAQRRDHPETDFTYSPTQCQCQVPQFEADDAALMESGYDPWCRVPTVEQGIAAVDHALYYVGVGTVLELPIESQGLMALAEALVGFGHLMTEAARLGMAASGMVFQQAFGAVLHAENALMLPVNCQVGMPYDGRYETPVDDAKAARALFADACGTGSLNTQCQEAEKVLQAIGGGDDASPAQLSDVTRLSAAARHRTQFDACKRFGSTFSTPLCQVTNYGSGALDCMCNPELEVLDGHPTLACRALNRVPPGTVVQHALGNEVNRMKWHNVYDEIGSTRFTRAMAAYEWLLYRVDSVGMALEALVDAFSMPGSDTACNAFGDEQYLVSGHTTLSVFYEIDDATGNIRMRSLLQGLTYDANSGQLRRDTAQNAPPVFSPCTDGEAPPSKVCPVVAYDNALCGGGAAARTAIQGVSIAGRQIFSTALAVLTIDPSAIDIEFGTVMCQAMREEAVLAGIFSSALSVIVDETGNHHAARQVRRALARGTFTAIDAALNIWPVLLNLVMSALNGMVAAGPGNFDLDTVYSVVLMVFDFYAAITCQWLEAWRALMAALGVDASFLQGVKDVLGIAVEYVNGQLLEFMIVIGRAATHFFTFVFGDNPGFSVVIQDLLLVIGVIARFVLNNVFTIIRMFFLVLGDVGHVINEMLTATCSALFGFLGLIVDGVNKVPFVSLDNPFDPVPCVRRRLMEAHDGNSTVGHVHYGQYWDSWVARGRDGPDAGLWLGTGPCALAMHGHEKPHDAVIEGCLRNRAFVGKVRRALGVHDVPLDVLDGLRPAVHWVAGVLQVLMAGGNWAASARQGLPAQSARAVYEIAGTVATRAASFLGPDAWRRHVVPQLFPDENVTDPNSQGNGARVYRALGAAHRLGHDIRQVRFSNRTKGVAPAWWGDDVPVEQPVVHLGRRRLQPSHDPVPLRRRLGAVGPGSASLVPSENDAVAAVLQAQDASVSDDQCPSELVCTHCKLLDSLLGSIVRYGMYVGKYYGADGPLQQTTRDFNAYMTDQQGNFVVPGDDGDGDHAGDDALKGVMLAHQDAPGFYRAVGRFLTSGDADEVVGFGLGKPLPARVLGLFEPCDAGPDGGDFGCRAPAASVGAAAFRAAAAAYLGVAVGLGWGMGSVAAGLTFLATRYTWNLRCGLALPPCLVRDAQLALQSVLVPCVCTAVAPSLVQSDSCDPSTCGLGNFDAVYRDCPTRNPLEYPLRLWRHASPATFYAVMAPFFADVRALGMDDLLDGVRQGVPLSPEAVTCDVYLGLPVSVLVVTLVVGPGVVLATKLAAQQVPAAMGVVGLGFQTVGAAEKVGGDSVGNVRHGATWMLNVVLVLGYAVLVLGGTNRTSAMADILSTSVYVVVVTHGAAYVQASMGWTEKWFKWWLVVATVVAAVVPCVGVMVGAASSWFVSLATAVDLVVAVVLALSDYCCLALAAG